VSIVETERIDGVPVARVRADIDAASAASVHDVLAGALAPDTDCLIVDLSETRYLDSAGLDMLLRLAERLSQRRVTLMLVIPEGSHVSRLATIVGLPEALPVHPTLSDARDSCTTHSTLIAEEAERQKTAAG